MEAKSTYREVRKKLQEDAGEVGGLKCRRCKCITTSDTLSSYGGLCGPCYGVYCREQTAGIKGTAPEGAQHAWAHRLKSREEAGERLTLVQRDMWRDALKHANAVLNAAKDGAPVPAPQIAAALRVTGDLPHDEPPPWLEDVPVFEH